MSAAWPFMRRLRAKPIELRDLDDHALRDLGIDRSEIESIEREGLPGGPEPGTRRRMPYRPPSARVWRRGPASLLGLLMLGGCALPVAPVAADREGPDRSLPAALPAPTARVASDLPLDHWWTLFNDRALDALMGQAMEHNHDLAEASARIRAARAELDIVHAASLPRAELQARHARSRQSDDAPAPLGAARHHGSHQWTLQASHEVDLWGRLEASDAAARQRLLAQHWARSAVAWALSAQLAEAHFTLRAVQRQIDISLAVRASRAQTLTLRVQEWSAGAGSEFELRRAEAELAATDAALVQLRQQRTRLQGTLALLSGSQGARFDPPGAEPQPLEPDEAFEPRLPAGGVSLLLVHRPDLRQAEARLIETQADIAAARAAMLPTLQLSGQLGADARSITRLLDGPGLAWSLAAAVGQTLWDGGAGTARVAQARAMTDAARVAYQRTVLQAVVELREAYAALALQAEAHEAQLRKLRALEQARRLAERGVAAGLLARIDLLDAERSAFQAQLDAVATYRDRLLGQVAVLKALGGGHTGGNEPSLQP